MRPEQPTSPTLSTGAVQIVGIVCALGVVAVLYGAAYRPLASWRVAVHQEAEMLRAKLPHSEAMRSQHKTLQEELHRLQDRIKEVNQRVPDEPRDGEFLANISQLAEQHGIFLKDFRRQKIDTQPTHSTVSVSLSGMGDFGAICRFLASIDALPRMSSLTKLEVHTRGTGPPYPIDLGYTLCYGLQSAQ